MRDLTCQKCGVGFQDPMDSGIGRPTRFCDACISPDSLYQREYARRRRARNAVYVTLECAHTRCSNTFTELASRCEGHLGRKYCSHKCGGLATTATRCQRRRARLRGALSENVDRCYIYARDGGRCQQCGKRVTFSDMTAGHIIPVTPYTPGDPPGDYTNSNIRVECAPCNKGKSNRPANEQLMLVG